MTADSTADSTTGTTTDSTTDPTTATTTAMTTNTADMLTYAEQLESTGLTRDQAVAIARGSASMLEERLKALATKADLESLSESMSARMDSMSARMDTLATRDELQLLADKMDYRFALIDTRLNRLDDLPAQMRVNTWMLAVVVVVLVVPRLQEWFVT